MVCAAFITFYEGAEEEEYLGSLYLGSLRMNAFGVISMYLGGPLEPKASRTATFFVMIGFSFFALLMVSAYTAQLATFLVTTANAQVVETIDDAIRGGKICAHYLDLSLILRDHPNAGASVLTYSGWGGVLQAFDDGLCMSAVVSEDSMLQAHSLGTNCEVTRSKNPLFVVPTGFPIRKVSPGKSMTVAVRVMQDELQKLLADAVPVSTCPTAEDKDDKLKPITPLHTVGILLVTSGFMLASVFEYFVEAATQNTEGKQDATEGTSLKDRAPHDASRTNFVGSQIAKMQAQLEELKAGLEEQPVEVVHGASEIRATNQAVSREAEDSTLGVLAPVHRAVGGGTSPGVFPVSRWFC
jgi:hypothetical protein